tara:strand:- start:551 stop:1303 length:753 start_codon:yes stop_codon:yes gene_type:complete
LKFSIIIATLNNEETIERNLQSIKNQNYYDYEVIIIDGNSKDKTIDLIKKFEFKNIKIKSQVGKGVYNAFNEGIYLSRGEIIVILNADDFFEKDYALKKISNEFELDNNISLLMTNIRIINKKNQILRIYKNNFFKSFMFYFGLMPPHPGIFVKKNIYENLGFFKEEFKNAGDFEFLLRVIGKNKIKYKKIDDFFVSMSHGGKSNKNLKSYLINTYEIKKALKMNNFFSSYLLIIIRFLIKIFQFKRISL